MLTDLPNLLPNEADLRLGVRPTGLPPTSSFLLEAAMPLVTGEEGRGEEEEVRGEAVLGV